MITLATCLVAGSASATVSVDSLPVASYIQYETTSYDRIAAEYEANRTVLSPRAEAAALFGEQRSFTQDEEETRWKAMNARSKDIGVSVFDLFGV